MLFGVLSVLVGAAIVRWQAARHFVEEPGFEVIARPAPDIEIRRYAPMVVAETRVEQDFDRAPNTGFRRLAGFIFGGNATRESLAMTAPVTQRTNETLAMTVPVTQAADGGASVVSFVMPPGRTIDSLPIPNDGSVRLRAVPARTVAVLTYRGMADQDAFTERTRALEDALRAAGYAFEGPASSARYDPPTTLPWLRRNEIWLEIAG